MNKYILLVPMLVFLWSIFVWFPPVSHAATTYYNGTNTTLSGDDRSTEIPIGFSFDFFGTPYTTAHVSTNGLITFGSGSTTYSNAAIPSSGSPNNMIAAFWDDLIVQSGKQTIYYHTYGTVPNRVFVVQWTNMYFYSNPSLQLGTFQAYLFEGSNDIVVQYPALLGSPASFGASATVGIENSAADGNSIQIFNNSASLTEGQAIRFTENAGSYSANSGATYIDVYLNDPAAPTQPSLAAPANGATGIATTPTFSWAASTNANSYRLIVASDATFSTIVVNQSNISETSYTLPSALSNETEYFWRVEAINNNGTALSGSRSFTTIPPGNSPPNAPGSLGTSGYVSGGYGTDTTPTLSFVTSDPNGSDTVQYRIQIDDSSDFSSPVVDYTSALASQGNTGFTVGQAAGGGSYAAGSAGQQLPDGAYYWRVRTIDADGAASSYTTANSGDIAFHILTSSPGISNISISATENSITATWTTAQQASSQVQYGLTRSMGKSTTETNVLPGVVGHSVTISSLKPCTRYFLTLQSRNYARSLKESDMMTIATKGCALNTVTDGAEDTIPRDNGGTVEYGNDPTRLVKLEIPPDFASATTTFQINKLDSREITVTPPNLQLAETHIYRLIAVNTTNDAEVTRFEKPLTFVIAYPAETEDSFIENTLDVYLFTGNAWEKQECVLDTDANTLTCTLEHFSTYGVFGEPQEATGQTTPHRDLAQPSSTTTWTCPDTMPVGKPDLFQIDRSERSATLYFTPVQQPYDRYYISYGNGTATEGYGIEVPYSNAEGVISYTIHELDPAQTYSVTVRAGNGCAPGQWGNALTITPLQEESVAVFYR